MADITPKPGEVELLDRRSVRRKVFQKPDGGVRVVNTVRALHYQDAGAWKSVDIKPKTADGRTFTTTDTPYILAFDRRALSLTYTSKAGGSVTIKLLQIGGVNVGNFNGQATIAGEDVTLRVATDLDIVLRVRPFGIEIFKVLHSANAAKALRWQVSYQDKGQINFDLMGTSGLDNLNRVTPREGLDVRRRIEMTHTKSAETVNAGVTTYTVDETFTGRTRLIDVNTMARTWVNDVVYPVEIDVTVNEGIVATADDGYGMVYAYWRANQSVSKRLTGGGKHAAWRFQTVDIPQGATISSATLTVRVIARLGSGSGTIKGNDVDDAASWADASANSPALMTATTANTSYAIPGTTGIKTIDVTSIVQEIVDRAGWTNNNDIRIGFTDVSGFGAVNDYVYFEDYQAAGTDEALLDIEYTTGAAGQPTMRRFGGVPGMGQGQSFGRSW